MYTSYTSLSPAHRVLYNDELKAFSASAIRHGISGSLMGRWVWKMFQNYREYPLEQQRMTFERVVSRRTGGNGETD